MGTDQPTPLPEEPQSRAVSTVSVVPGGPVTGTVQPPGSKSLTNRALICAAIAKGSTQLTGALVSEDTEVMLDSLSKVGLSATTEEAGRTIKINQGLQAAPDSQSSDPIELYIANSGTSIRFLTAMLSALGGHYRLTGLPRMHERPIGDLTRSIGEVIHGSITTESPNDCPPVLIQGEGWQNSEISVAGSVSSQYLSGLMMAAPLGCNSANLTNQDVLIHVRGELVSRPYVEMTASVMRAFGASVQLIDSKDSDEPLLTVKVQPGGYEATCYAIEPDASAASYFWAAAAITGGSVTVEGLTPDALQGDVGFCKVLEKMGCQLTLESKSMTISGRARRGIDVDMNHISDTVQTLAVVALFAEGPTRIRGVAHNRYKETDRIGDLATELRKLGANVEEHEDGLTIEAHSEQLTGSVIETYDDHRMAMSLSLAGLRIPGVQISNPSCTAKTYPNFFADLEQLLGRPHQWSSAE